MLSIFGQTSSYDLYYTLKWYVRCPSKDIVNRKSILPIFFHIKAIHVLSRIQIANVSDPLALPVVIFPLSPSSGSHYIPAGSQRLSGAIALRHDPSLGAVDVAWGHCTASFVLGYMSAASDAPQVNTAPQSARGSVCFCILSLVGSEVDSQLLQFFFKIFFRLRSQLGNVDLFDCFC